MTTVVAALPWTRAVNREVERGNHDVVVVGAGAPAWWSSFARHRRAAPVLRPAPARGGARPATA